MTRENVEEVREIVNPLILFLSLCGLFCVTSIAAKPFFAMAAILATRNSIVREVVKEVKDEQD